MKHCIYIARVLALILIFAGCDSPTDNKNTKKKPKPEYSFAFDTKEQRVLHKAGGSYTQEVKEKNKPATDKREITYSSSEPKIATVDETTGTVTFKTAGTVTITAIKKADSTHEEVKATYTLYITTNPEDFDSLVEEIKRAMAAHGNDVDLNYINISAIKDMSHLFASGSHSAKSYDLNKFVGDISKWDVSQVTNMSNMFAGAEKFNSDISNWDVSQVTDMNSMFFGATKFNSDISKWNVLKVSDMSAMFDSATSFTQNLNTWKINKEVKENDWQKAEEMFQDSGLADKLPSWCDAECQKRQE